MCARLPLAGVLRGARREAASPLRQRRRAAHRRVRDVGQGADRRAGAAHAIADGAAGDAAGRHRLRGLGDRADGLLDRLRDGAAERRRGQCDAKAGQIRRRHAG
eukprot:2634644-Prymnesium_polylepis.1